MEEDAPLPIQNVVVWWVFVHVPKPVGPLPLKVERMTAGVVDADQATGAYSILRLDGIDFLQGLKIVLGLALHGEPAQLPGGDFQLTELRASQKVASSDSIANYYHHTESSLKL